MQPSLLYFGFVAALLQQACIHATINRVIPNMFYQVSGCEGDNVELQCDKGYFIEIYEGSYGRTSPTECIKEGEDPVPESKLPCGGLSVFDMHSVTSCNGQEVCKLHVTPEHLQVETDPCPNLPKYLNVSFNCIKAIVENFACEGDTLILSCPGEEVIQIVDVLYGRNERKKCTEGEGSMKNTECYAVDAGWTVSELCNHKPYCEIQASAKNFGDPCEDTSKYLHVVYQCASCVNEHGDDEKCDNYALRGECEANPPWMMAQCRKSCWRCDTNTMCLDKSDFYECTKWAAVGECRNNEKWMKENCQFSCNRCWESLSQGEVNDGDQQGDPHFDQEEAKQQEEQDEGTQEDEEEKVEVHKRDTRNYSDETDDSQESPLKRYYSLIALGGTVLVMTFMAIWLSLRPKENTTFKKSA